GPPVIENHAVVLPPPTFTLGEDRLTNPVLSSASAIFTPVPGAGEFRVIVPVTVFPTPTTLELNVSVMVACPTLIVANPGLKPDAEAKMFVVPTATGVIVAAVLIVPAGTVTVTGAVAMVGSRTVSVITWPLTPAGCPSVTVIVPTLVMRLSGSGASVMELAGAAVIVTVDGRLSWIPSFTINCATYVPCKSAT